MTRALPGQTIQVTSRPQRARFRIERVFIGRSEGEEAGVWTVNDITIGNRSQFEQCGSLPGDMFSSKSTDSFVSFDIADPWTDITMIVTYNGKNPEGIPFIAGMLGMEHDPGLLSLVSDAIADATASIAKLFA